MDTILLLVGREYDINKFLYVEGVESVVLVSVPKNDQLEDISQIGELKQTDYAIIFIEAYC